MGNILLSLFSNGVIADILAFIIVVSIIVVFHEFGHFIVAKILGVKVENFSLGFGPKLISKKIGETEYAISALPLGGYVKLMGEDPEEELSPEDEKRSFSKLSPFKKFLIIFFGPMFNFILALVILTIIFSAGKPVLKSVVGKVIKGDPAVMAGLKKGDVITSVNGKKLWKWTSLSSYIQKYGKHTIVLGVKRPINTINNKTTNNKAVKESTATNKINYSKTFFIHVKPKLISGLNIFKQKIKRYIIGIYPSNVTVNQSRNIFSAFYAGLKEVWFIIYITILSVYMLIAGKIPATDLGGPIMIAQLSGRAASMGLSQFFYFIAVISVNIGLVNLFPIPALDGGHILFSFVEMIRRRPLSPKFQENAAKIGFALLIMLLLFVSYNDIMRNIKT
ncbi:MAG: RIP metalloprotease RseP [Candidatus Acididesulfobacter diazotrophicus]|jgi:regulator of sigma E protease|uniref:Zinc metalloprotease n=1 Tax=Candidatus Acididesulfobacter diazotrophicus TaxID=2597226 RepID=A0A519BMD0_9DELT|nr:MAG: RIP metalloprotease RseP [Candidatus Acididesulfobacter diazotrophicus]